MPPTSRDRYRHGDLRTALLEAGLAMARVGGPDTVVLREATRRAGVAPNAAYRHFADRAALVRAVSDRALSMVAAEIETRVAAVDPALPADEAARERLRAVGRGYLAFAMLEPGLFRAAFTVPSDLSHAADPERQGPGGGSPFELLGRALDELVATGQLAPERRAGAEYVAWSAVHGLACLALEGPLRGLDDATVAEAAERVVETVVRGL